MRDKIAENLEQFLQRPLAPRKPNSELPPEVLIFVCSSTLVLAIQRLALQSPDRHMATTLKAALSPLTKDAVRCTTVPTIKLSCPNGE